MPSCLLRILLASAVCIAAGCKPSESQSTNVKTNAQAANQRPVPRSTDADGPRDRVGHLTTISLRDQDMTVADLAQRDDANRLERLDAHSAGLTDTDMAALARFSQLKELKLNVNSKITDDGLRHLEGLGELQVLSLFFCPQLTGSGFKHLTKLDKLENLNIGNNQNITDEGLLHLRQLESLQVLLASPLHGVTDEGVKHLSEIRSLRRLRLSGAQITDAGLEHLASLKNLEVLTLSRDHSEAAIAKLQQTLPDCKIQQ